MQHDDPDQPGRRRFLRRSIYLVPAAAAASTATVGPALSQAPPPAASAAGAASASPAAPYQPVFLNATEWQFIQAAVARLIPADDVGPGAVEAGVPEFIDRQLDGAWGHGALFYSQGPFHESSPLFGYQGALLPRDLYRTVIAAVDKWCQQQRGGKLFAELDPAAQDEVLKGLESGAIVFEGSQARDFFAFLLANTKEGYFSDPIHGGNKNGASWTMIGFPGARADFMDWVQRPGEAYPLPTVTIGGRQG